MRKPFYVSSAVAFTVAVAALPIRAFNEPIDYDAINKIKTQGLVEANSKVMETMSYLTDVSGPRLTGSPNIEKAGQWAVKQMTDWGLTGATMEAWPADAAGNNNGFPRGWRMKSSTWPLSRRSSSPLSARRRRGRRARAGSRGATR